jgi:predicted helicase
MRGAGARVAGHRGDRQVPEGADSDGPPGLVVVFSTYQSIEAVSKAQKAGCPHSI